MNSMFKCRVLLQDTSNGQNNPSLHNFETWIAALFKNIKTNKRPEPLEVSIRIIDLIESARLNLAYRKQSKPTNVLSFPNTPEPEFEDNSLGDIAICADLVEREANQQGIPSAHHWAHLTVHGTLHLLGYHHIEDDDAERMESLEVEILHSLNIPNPYQDETEN